MSRFNPQMPAKKRALLDHSIVGQKETSLTVRKDRNLAACRMCGDIFQPLYFIEATDEQFNQTDMDTLSKKFQAEQEIMSWRVRHNRKHTEKEHFDFATSGLTFTPEAAKKLAPFGLVPVGDLTVVNSEVGQALAEAPRLPNDDVETTSRGLVNIPKGF